MSEPMKVIALEELGEKVVIGFINQAGELEYNTYIHEDGGSIEYATNPGEDLIEMEGLSGDTMLLLDNLDTC